MCLVCSYLPSIWRGQRPLLLRVLRFKEKRGFVNCRLSILCKYLPLPKIEDRHITQSQLGMAWVPVAWGRGKIHLIQVPRGTPLHGFQMFGKATVYVQIRALFFAPTYSVIFSTCDENIWTHISRSTQARRRSEYVYVYAFLLGPTV